MLFFKFARFTPPTPALINRKSDDRRHGEGSVTPLLFFVSVSNGNVLSHFSQNSELQTGTGAAKSLPL